MVIAMRIMLLGDYLPNYTKQAHYMFSVADNLKDNKFNSLIISDCWCNNGDVLVNENPEYFKIFNNEFIKLFSIDPLEVKYNFHNDKLLSLLGLCYDAIRYNDISLVYANELFPYGFIASILKERFKIPFVISNFHTNINHALGNVYMKSIAKEIISKADYIIGYAYQRLSYVKYNKNFIEGYPSYSIKSNIIPSSKAEKKYDYIFITGKIHQNHNIKKLVEAIKFIFQGKNIVFNVWGEKKYEFEKVIVKDIKNVKILKNTLTIFDELRYISESKYSTSLEIILPIRYNNEGLINDIIKLTSLGKLHISNQSYELYKKLVTEDKYSINGNNDFKDTILSYTIIKNIIKELN
ncbi:hypothetical protein HZI73_05300 [Vallitalea pronyensis]|uniref:Glycosyltransferase n=1 Tax=Vallitalea pronyensis TaxID=1348613 RepID=A0A8J8MHX0_9FIRM|nr:hypothetical protein [Vallitalea pronyensis]QUI21742.1 hypothetical protein HZI73_05300 [Vallitalea pronyensis]